VAQAYNTTPLVIILAWLMRHPTKIIPIYGSVRPEAIRESVKAPEITLDRESWYRIWHAARA
jgi:predicted oxidoreductase